MTWTKLDDDFYSNPKTLELTDGAGFLIARVWSWIGRHGRDGHISDAALESMRHPRGAVEELVDKGWLHHRGREGDQCNHLPHCAIHLPNDVLGGFVAHDYLDRNPTRAENAVHRKKIGERRNSKLRLLVFDRDSGRCRYCAVRVSMADHKSPRGFTLDHVNPQIAIGAGGVVTACKACNSAKKDRTPSEANMVLLPPLEPLPEGVDDPTLHMDELDPYADPTQYPGSIRDAPGDHSGSGTGRVGSGRVGSGGSSTQRDLASGNPYLRSSSLDLTSDVAWAGSPPRPAAAAAPEIQEREPSPHRPRPQPAKQSRKRRKGRRR